MAHAEDMRGIAGTPEIPLHLADRRRLYSNISTIHRSVADTPDQQPEQTGFGSDIDLAISFEERALLLSVRCEEIEDTVRLARMFLSAAAAIEDILVDSRRLLESGRNISEPAGRNALAGTFARIKTQIDNIVADAEFDGQNIAAGDVLELALNEGNSRSFRIDSSALTVDALGLSAVESAFLSDAELIATIVAIENAINTVKTRRTVIEMTISVLSNRAKFARDKVRSLRDSSRLLIEEDKAYVAICDMATRRISDGSLMDHAQKQFACQNATDKNVDTHSTFQSHREGKQGKREEQDDKISLQVLSQQQVSTDATELTGAGPENSIDERLNELAKDLARFIDKDSYLSNWFKYEAGEIGIFTECLARAYSPDLIKEFAQNYSNDGQFKSVADKFMAAFENWIESEAEGGTDRKDTIERLLKTDQGTVYIVLMRACDRL